MSPRLGKYRRNIIHLIRLASFLTRFSVKHTNMAESQIKPAVLCKPEDYAYPSQSIYHIITLVNSTNK